MQINGRDNTEGTQIGPGFTIACRRRCCLSVDFLSTPSTEHVETSTAGRYIVLLSGTTVLIVRQQQQRPDIV